VTGDIGLDVYYRGAVEGVQPLYGKDITPAFEQFYCRFTYGIRAVGGAAGK
jgi:hypothetical protein